MLSIRKTHWRKREQEKDKKDIWDFYEPFSLQCAIPNKPNVYSRCICHGLYDVLVIIPLPLSIEPLQNTLPQLLLRYLHWDIAKQFHVM